ncbi:MAG TPA: BBE domain-containing protein, partial [Candidatus Limnocylindria bacterium]|nr:BBE domain-containing protein [Candidatus Limnocylindria bacterium]
QTVDNLRGVELDTADGERVRAGADTEPELFWGLRGGGGNFGVVTGFEFRAYPLGPSMHGGNFIYHRPKWPDALHAFREWTADLPDALTAIVTFMTPDPSWELGDETVLLIGFAWAGTDRSEMLRLVAPLRSALAADVEELEPTTWVQWQSAADELFPKGLRAYWKNAAMHELPDGAIEAIVAAADAMAPRKVGIDIHHMGGAFGRVPEDATPFPNRAATYWINCYGVWDSPSGDEAGRDWARGAHAALLPYAAAGEYVNFLGAAPGEADPTAAALTSYGEAKLARLRALKRRWDPDNVFRRNHNIQ